MSFESQQKNMRRMAKLLENDLGYIWGEKESGPNGDKKGFLRLGKVFLRALAEDLGLREVKVTSNAGGIAVSGECSLYGMWESGGIYVCIGQFCGGKDVVLYRSIRHINDHKGGYNNFVTMRELSCMSYQQMVKLLLRLRKDAAYERAA